MPNLLSDIMCCSSVEATREADMHAFPKTGAVAAGARRGTLIGWKAGCANPLDRSVATFAANNEGEPMGLSDWVSIFAIITFIGFASVVYEVATRAFDD
jgi:hypothetical protein